MGMNNASVSTKIEKHGKCSVHNVFSLSWPKATCSLHHNQIFDIIIEKSDYDIKNLIMMHKSRGF